MTPNSRRRGGSIDWAAVHARLARANAATEGALTVSAERAKRIMDERARALARPREPDEPAGERIALVTFGLANERYAIETPYVRTLLRLTELTPVPNTPDFLAGVVSLRGDILAVIDLRKFFGLARSGLTDLSRLVVLGRERAEFGVLADEVHEVSTLLKEDLRPPPGDAGQGYVKAVTGDALILLDGARLLDDDRLFIDQREQSSLSFGTSEE